LWDPESIAQSVDTIIDVVVGSVLVLSSSVLFVNPASVRGRLFRIRGAVLSRLLRRQVTGGARYFDRRWPWLAFLVIGLALAAVGIAKLD
jgi:hypothetical protein